MKKQIISAVLAAALTLSPACAFAGEYYGDTELPDIYYSDIDTSAPDEAELDKALDEAHSYAKNHDAEGMSAALDKVDELDEQLDLAYSAAYLRASQHNTEDNNKASDAIHASLTSQAQKEIDFVKAYADDPQLRDALIDWCGGEEDFNDIIGGKYTEKYFELSNKDKELVSEYNANTLDTIVYTHTDGNSYTIEDIYDRIMEMFFGEPSEEEIADLTELYNSALSNATDTLGGIYKRMVEVRTDMAKEQGYDNYSDFAYAEIYKRDFTNEEVAAFREAVKENIVPLADYYDNLAYDPYIEELDTDSLVDLVGTGMGKISPELKESFDFMSSHGFVDICENEDRITPGTAYTTTLGTLPVPFVFVSTMDDDKQDTFTTLVHEFGHFNAMLRSSLAYGIENEDMAETDGSVVDIQEVYSQGLEMLYTHKYPELMTLRGSSDMSLVRVEAMLHSIIDGCIMDEWQDTVYRDPDMSIDEMNECYSRIAGEYGQGSSDFPAWIGVPHNFIQPMYYISYAVSAMAALDLWAYSLYDYDGAVDRYMKLTANEMGSFKKTLGDNGFDNIFDKAVIENITAAAYSYYFGGYYDIDFDDWYVDDARITAPFFDLEKASLFRGNDPMTRGETAITIGKFNEYSTSVKYTGTSTFVDAQTTYAAWTADAGVIKGYDETTLGASDTLTREQAVTMLYRYANHEGLTLELEEDFGINDFPDNAEISDWAAEAFDWAVAAGMIYGMEVSEDSDYILAPQGTLTRAQFAAMLTRLITYSSMGLAKG